MSNILIVSHAADQAGQCGKQDGADNGHGLGQDWGQVTVIPDQFSLVGFLIEGILNYLSL